MANITANHKLSNIEVVFILFFVLIATIYIISGAFVGITGNHTWRQADVYGHILGFMEYKNFKEYDSFKFGKKVIFDIPIYQWIIAKISLFLDIKPLLVTNILNYVLWLITAFSGYLISNIIGKKFAGLSFLFLMSTSALMLHYYSVPLPDTLSIALSMLALLTLLYYKINYKSLFIVTPLFIIATLIKSPIVFIFILFYIIYIVITKEIYLSMQVGTILKKNTPILILFFILIISVIASELLRKYLLGDIVGFSFAQDPSWYFGTWQLRTEQFFWDQMIIDLNDSGIYIFSIIYLIVVNISFFMNRDRILFALTFATTVSFFVGWLTFANVYMEHDYYKLPITIILFISLSVSLSYIINFIYTQYLKSYPFWMQPITVLLIIVITLHIMFTQNYLSDREKAIASNSAKDILSNHDIFAYVTDQEIKNPSIGAILGTKFIVIKRDKFESNCFNNLQKYQAIVTTKESQCLNKHKYLLNNIVELEHFKTLSILDIN